MMIKSLRTIVLVFLTIHLGSTAVAAAFSLPIPALVNPFSWPKWAQQYWNGDHQSSSIVDSSSSTSPTTTSTSFTTNLPDYGDTHDRQQQPNSSTSSMFENRTPKLTDTFQGDQQSMPITPPPSSPTTATLIQQLIKKSSDILDDSDSKRPPYTSTKPQTFEPTTIVDVSLLETSIPTTTLSPLLNKIISVSSNDDSVLVDNASTVATVIGKSIDEQTESTTRSTVLESSSSFGGVDQDSQRIVVQPPEYFTTKMERFSTESVGPLLRGNLVGISEIPQATTTKLNTKPEKNEPVDFIDPIVSLLMSTLRSDFPTTSSSPIIVPSGYDMENDRNSAVILAPEENTRLRSEPTTTTISNSILNSADVVENRQSPSNSILFPSSKTTMTTQKEDSESLLNYGEILSNLLTTTTGKPNPSQADQLSWATTLAQPKTLFDEVFQPQIVTTKEPVVWSPPMLSEGFTETGQISQAKTQSEQSNFLTTLASVPYKASEIFSTISSGSIERIHQLLDQSENNRLNNLDQITTTMEMLLANVNAKNDQENETKSPELVLENVRFKPTIPTTTSTTPTRIPSPRDKLFTGNDEKQLVENFQNFYYSNSAIFDGLMRRYSFVNERTHRGLNHFDLYETDESSAYSPINEETIRNDSGYGGMMVMSSDTQNSTNNNDINQINRQFFQSHIV